MHPHVKFNKIRQFPAELLLIQSIFITQFSGDTSQSWASDLCQIWGRDRAIIVAPTNFFWISDMLLHFEIRAP